MALKKVSNFLSTRSLKKQIQQNRNSPKPSNEADQLKEIRRTISSPETTMNKLRTEVSSYCDNTTLNSHESCPNCHHVIINKDLYGHIKICVTDLAEAAKNTPPNIHTSSESYETFEQNYRYTKSQFCYGCKKYIVDEEYGMHLIKCIDKKSNDNSICMKGLHKLISAPTYPVPLSRNQFVAVVHSQMLSEEEKEMTEDMNTILEINIKTLSIAKKVEKDYEQYLNNNNNNNRNNSKSQLPIPVPLRPDTDNNISIVNELSVINTSFTEYYTRQNSIGYGQSSAIYSVQNKINGFMFAAKRMTKASDPTHQMSEIHTMRLQHPNICNALDIFDNEQFIWIVMPRFDISLRRLIQFKIKYNIKNTTTDTYIILGIYNGLECLHFNRIIHRDLKPENVMLTASDVKLIDFGHSFHEKFRIQLSGNKNIQPQSAGGTKGYQAPELISREKDDQKEYTAAVDIWSFGALIFDLLLPIPFGQIETTQDLISNFKTMCSDYKQNKCNEYFDFKLLKNMLNTQPNKRPQISDLKQNIYNTFNKNKTYYDNKLSTQFLLKSMINIIYYDDYEAIKEDYFLRISAKIKKISDKIHSIETNSNSNNMQLTLEQHVRNDENIKESVRGYKGCFGIKNEFVDNLTNMMSKLGLNPSIFD